MTALGRLSGRFGGLFPALLAALLPLLLAGCLQSKTLLLADTDFVQPLPDAFTLFTYKAEGDVFKLATENGKPKVTQFSRKGAGYAVDGEQGALYFMPNGDGAYLAAITGPNGVLYGFADIKGQAIVTRFVSADPEKELDRLRQTPEGGAALADVVYKDGSLILPTREALMFLAEQLRSGALELQGGPFYWLPGHVDGTDPAAAAPESIDAQGKPAG